MPSPFARFKHRILFPIRERIVCSEKEAIAMVVLLMAVFSGHVIRIVQATKPVFDDSTYAEMDSLFMALSASADSAQRRAHSTPVDTIHIGYGATFDDVPIRNGGTESWVLVDTLEKPKASFPIAINSADARTLQALPRIGPAMAERIIRYRTANGTFRSGDDLLGVRGIGPKTLEKLLPLIIFEVAPDTSGTNQPDTSGTQ